MAKNKKVSEINLLPREEFEASVVGRVLKWLLGTFRYIVIITEMIVMSAFLSRFYFDSRSADLTNAINQKQSIISSYSTFENQFRATQAKLTTFLQYANPNQKLSPVIQDINSKLPNNIVLTQITLSNQTIQIIATGQDEQAAATFLSNLNSSSFLQNIVLTSVESKQGSGISFTLSGAIKGGQSGS